MCEAQTPNATPQNAEREFRIEIKIFMTLKKFYMLFLILKRSEQSVYDVRYLVMSNLY